MNIQFIYPEKLAPWVSKTVVRPPDTPAYEYTAITIEEGGRHYYRAKGVSIAISKYEAQCVKANPRLYYFSTALRLHHRILQKLRGEH